MYRRGSTGPRELVIELLDSGGQSYARRGGGGDDGADSHFVVTSFRIIKYCTKSV